MTTDSKIACGLVRVSSEEQARGGYGLEFQDQDIRAFCTRSKFGLVQVFRDEGYSGATAERPGFQEMMQWARAKRFHVLVVWKLDRLFRDTKLTLQTVDELAALGIEVRSVQESFTHDSNGRFLLTIFAAGAEKERRDIALRMQAGRIASARRGTWVSGGGTPPFGYRYDADRKRLAIDQSEAKLVKLMYQWLVHEKLSLYKLQSRINDLRIPTKFDRIGRKRATGAHHWWAKRTIGRILTNGVYTGTFTFRKYAKPGLVHDDKNLRPEEDWVTIPTPAIISKALFDGAQAQLQSNRVNSPRKTRTLYLLRGLLVCGQDRRRMQAARRPRDRFRECKYYFCSGIRKGVTPIRCASRSVSESRIAEPVWEQLTELLTHPSIVLKQIAAFRERTINPIEINQQIDATEAQKIKLLDRKKRLVELYLASAVDANFFREENLRLNLETDRVEEEVSRIRNLQISQQEIASRARTIAQLYEQYRAMLSQPSDEVKRDLLKLFVAKVTVRGEDLEISVNLPEPDAFVGQSPNRLSHKDTFPIFLHARLVPISEIFKKKGLAKNFGKWASRKPAK